MNKQLSWAALVLCGISLVLIATLTALHDPVPDVLNLVAIGALTGGASLAVPGSTETIRTAGSSSSSSSAPAPAPARSSSLAAAGPRVPVQSQAATSAALL